MAQVLYLTDPEHWSPHAAYQATRLFVSSLNARLAQRFLALVLLPHVRQDIWEHRRLHFALFQAMKKAAYKPDAFYKACGQCSRYCLIMSELNGQGVGRLLCLAWVSRWRHEVLRALAACGTPGGERWLCVINSSRRHSDCAIHYMECASPQGFLLPLCASGHVHAARGGDRVERAAPRSAAGAALGRGARAPGLDGLLRRQLLLHPGARLFWCVHGVRVLTSNKATERCGLYGLLRRQLLLHPGARLRFGFQGIGSRM